jgi:hypothetical protein
MMIFPVRRECTVTSLSGGVMAYPLFATATFTFPLEAMSLTASSYTPGVAVVESAPFVTVTPVRVMSVAVKPVIAWLKVKVSFEVDAVDEPSAAALLNDTAVG